MSINLFWVTFAVLVINLPFGFWRQSVKKFSLKWFLSVHLPVLAIILLRIYGEIGFAFYTYIFLVSAFFLGQKLGGIIFDKREYLIEKLHYPVHNR
ncbi:MAG: hypothetical protein KKF62_07105 [Bacteroidetes bacterium]|nr:hypothetical protein [Bacteroidota bacterium]MBU1114093.1 hypothetical protein [Bacteroidota bacterium]MBU1800166.1 hypothetical protein [Bacteroidota bacterium]